MRLSRWRPRAGSPSGAAGSHGAQVILTRTAAKQVVRLPSPAQYAVVRFLREGLAAAEDPRNLGVSLPGDRNGLWRFRVGDYRLICEIQGAKITVLVVGIGPN